MTNEAAQGYESEATTPAIIRDSHPQEVLRQRVTELEVEVDGLKRALESRTVISAAVGMVMLAMPASEATAFRVLAYISQNTNTKMRALAESICRHVASGDGLPPEVADLLGQAIHRPGSAPAGSVRPLHLVPTD